MPECAHCGDDVGVDGVWTVPTPPHTDSQPDVTLCPRCHEGWTKGEPVVEHQWGVADAKIAGRGSTETYVVERCAICGDLRVDKTAEVIETVEEEDA